MVTGSDWWAMPFSASCSPSATTDEQPLMSPILLTVKGRTLSPERLAQVFLRDLMQPLTVADSYSSHRAYDNRPISFFSRPV